MPSQNGYLEVVKALLTADADVNRVADTDGVTPLLISSWKGHLDVVGSLLAAGADVNLANVKYGTTQLSKLLQYANASGESALFEASAKGHLHLVKELLAAGADKSIPMGDWTCGRFMKSLFYCVPGCGKWTAREMTQHNGHQEVAELLR